MSETAYRCEGKTDEQIANDARKMMEAAAVANQNGDGEVITAQALLKLLDSIEDGDAFLIPMAEALLSLVFERDATVTLSALRELQRDPDTRE